MSFGLSLSITAFFSCLKSSTTSSSANACAIVMRWLSSLASSSSTIKSGADPRLFNVINLFGSTLTSVCGLARAMFVFSLSSEIGKDRLDTAGLSSSSSSDQSSSRSCRVRFLVSDALRPLSPSSLPASESISSSLTSESESLSELSSFCGFLLGFFCCFEESFFCSLLVSFTGTPSLTN